MINGVFLFVNKRSAFNISTHEDPLYISSHSIF